RCLVWKATTSSSGLSIAQSTSSLVCSGWTPSQANSLRAAVWSLRTQLASACAASRWCSFHSVSCGGAAARRHRERTRSMLGPPRQRCVRLRPRATEGSPGRSGSTAARPQAPGEHLDDSDADLGALLQDVAEIVAANLEQHGILH